MIEAFHPYFAAIKSLDIHDATEHTLRGSLENLLKAIALEQNAKISVIHEPKRDKSGYGAPDFKFKLNEAILGYLENKKIEENLDGILKSSQIAKYKQLSDNIILTNYLEWVWLRDGRITKREALCDASDVGSHRARLDPDKAAKVGELIASFYSTPPQKIGTARVLSPALAVRCHELRDFLLAELVRQIKEHQEGRLYGLYDVFKTDVFHALELKEFADAFAQTLGYGLFLAKLNAGGNTPVTLDNAKRFIPGNFELIRELVAFLDELEKDEYQGIKWLVEEILSILNTLDLAAIHEDLAFTKKQPRLFEPSEEERLLFAQDPYIYFYEDFLKAYDKDTRKARGVYYTPPPVVNFIVRSVHDILKNTFGIPHGLADRRRVTVLDFATGTGTFLAEVLQQIFGEVSEGVRDQVVQEHILKNLYGFEYLIAPYTIAHLKLSQFLHDKGYAMQSGERLQIYLTNTLEPIEPLFRYLLPALSREVEQAQEIKEKPILVITGNPPYSGHSKNNGEWITKLIDDYKTVDGKPLGEKNSKWLRDDYVKFIRFAQQKMQDVSEGIVAIITNHSFLDNPTFRGMRQSLMQTFSQIYALNLHGSAEKREQTPDGDKDENVFEIKQGVSISLLVKKEGLPKAVYYADLWGRRKEKYRALLATTHTTLPWKELHPSTPFYLFIPQDETLRGEYEKGFKATEIFPVSSVGIVTADNSTMIGFSERELKPQIEKKFDEYDGKHAQPITYHPFDSRLIYYDTSKLERARTHVMRHMLEGKNIGIITTRLTKDEWSVFATDKIIAHKSGSRYDISYLFPLYIYPSLEEQEHGNTSLFNEPKENFRKEFRAFVDKQYSHHYKPEDILGYIYAVLHSPTYRQRYLESLKMDFPRIPFVDDRDTFEALSRLGWELVQAHLLKNIPNQPQVDVSKGSLEVEKPVYDAQNQRLYINKERSFFPVPQAAWGFHIGGYQVLDTYLKSRKGRGLTLDEIENIQNMVKVLLLTHGHMQKIDEVWKL